MFHIPAQTFDQEVDVSVCNSGGRHVHDAPAGLAFQCVFGLCGQQSNDFSFNHPLMTH